MRNLRTVLAVLALASGAAMGCSSSSSSGGGTDGGLDSPVNPTDAKTDSKPTGDSGKDSATDSPVVTPDGATDGPCNFATFVIGLINNDTTATAKPSTDLGQACTDDQNQADFKSLF